MVMAARPPVGSEADLLFDFLRYQRRDAAVLEAQRLLYVACTRAKCQLRLTAVIDDEHDDDLDDTAPRRVFRPHAGSLLRTLWPVLAGEFELPTAPLSQLEAADDAPRGGPLKRLPLEWSQDRRFAPPPGAAIAIRVVRDETPIFDWAGETARRVGSLVHAELHKMDLTSLDEAAIRAREGHFRRWLERNGVPENRLNQATARVVEALLGVHRDPRGRWILKSGYREDLREHALSGHRRGEFFRVVLDRSFIDDGVRWVIDYKTSQHQGGGLELFLDREVERYRSQLERYGQLARRLGPQPVRLGLYFPLMRAWREWAPDGAVD
jgi:ATP-dependent helicase/nuclease subunit A